MSQTKPDRSYTNGDIIVEWREPLCEHCELCHRELPKVFNPDVKPWVRMMEASTEAIAAQVTCCPSGALSLRADDGDAPTTSAWLEAIGGYVSETGDRLFPVGTKQKQVASLTFVWNTTEVQWNAVLNGVVLPTRVNTRRKVRRLLSVLAIRFEV